MCIRDRSATIGAALKKIAVALLTDKKVIKTIGGIVIGIIIIVVIDVYKRQALRLCLQADTLQRLILLCSLF